MSGKLVPVNISTASVAGRDRCWEAPFSLGNVVCYISVYLLLLLLLTCCFSSLVGSAHLRTRQTLLQTTFVTRFEHGSLPSSVGDTFQKPGIVAAHLDGGVITGVDYVIGEADVVSVRRERREGFVESRPVLVNRETAGCTHVLAGRARAYGRRLTCKGCVRAQSRARRRVK